MKIRPFSIERPAWAQSCGCKSRRELTTVNEVKRNGIRVFEYGKEAQSIDHERGWRETDILPSGERMALLTARSTSHVRYLYFAV